MFKIIFLFLILLALALVSTLFSGIWNSNNNEKHWYIEPTDSNIKQISRFYA
jgi:hypothetical protein